MEDREVVDLFVAHLRTHGHPDLTVQRRPDDENRGSPDIDAIAGNLAIEHTSVDTLPNQRRDSEWFVEAVGSLRDVLPTPPFRLRITVEYTAVTTGQNWADVRRALATWILTRAAELPDGRQVVEGIPGVPFRLHVRKDSETTPALLFSRWEPEDDTLSARIRNLFDRKARKLATYRLSGGTTVLLVQNGDIALMNDWKMLEAIKEAYNSTLPAGIDQIWYADSSIPGNIRFVDFTLELAPSAHCENAV